jgi:sugar/nucleoside kinase (ribokinase family)
VTASVTVIGGVQVDVVIVPVEALPPPGHTVLVDEMSFRVGGAGANAALAFAAAETPVRLLGCIGDDHLGRWLAEQLSPFGLAGDLSVLAADATGLTVACEAPERDRTFLTYLGVNSAWDRLPENAASCESLLLCDYFCLPALHGDRTHELFAAARGHGARTFFDTAWDAGGWRRETRAEVIELLPYVDVFLPNEAEARALADDRDSPIEDVARGLQQASGGWVVVKLGPRGCFAAGPDGGAISTPATRVRVVDSTGAGDAFNAGLIVALGEGGDWPSALRAATSLAARILARPSDDRRGATAARSA